jgi:hypothetical protein
MPFAFGLAVSFFMIVQKLADRAAGWIYGATVGGSAFLPLVWNWIYEPGDVPHEFSRKKKTSRMRRMKAVSDRNLLVQDFDRLPREIQWTHFGSLVAVTISAVLLITPAAYHRIAEHGEDSEQFHNFASRVMLAAMFFLGLGLAGDFFVVTYKITEYKCH